MLQAGSPESDESARKALAPAIDPHYYPIEVMPAWMQVVPGTLQIMIHQLPERAQIDTILTEQLIVELYSKN